MEQLAGEQSGYKVTQSQLNPKVKLVIVVTKGELEMLLVFVHLTTSESGINSSRKRAYLVTHYARDKLAIGSV